MKLHDLRPAENAIKKRKRVGRGEGSGWGKTAAKGEKGQKSRSGASIKAWFEGGQMPLHRRLSGKGRTNKFKKEWQVVNLKDFERMGDATEITPEILREHGLIRKLRVDVKILGDGDLKNPLTIHAHAFSKSAKQKIEEAGGKAVIIGEETA